MKPGAPDPADAGASGQRRWRRVAQAQVSSTVEATLAAQVAGRIEMLAAEHVPGSRLGSKDEMREIAGVSIGTMNEALRIAQTRGAITLRRGPGGGVFVATASSLVRMGSLMLGMETDENTINDALRMRNALDPFILRDAIAHATDEDVSDLHAMNAAMRDALKRYDIDEFIRRHWAYHARIASISPNTLIKNVFVSLLGVLDEQTIGMFPAGADLSEEIEIRLDTHERMALAIEHRDLDAAYAVMNDFIASQPESVRPPRAP